MAGGWYSVIHSVIHSLVMYPVMTCQCQALFYLFPWRYHSKSEGNVSVLGYFLHPSGYTGQHPVFTNAALVNKMW